MSSDYSNIERDYFRKQRRREDSKSSKISPKEIKVYEPKSAQKSIKTQGYADDSEQSSCYEYGYYTSYTKSAKKKNDTSHTFQGSSSSKTKNRGNNKFKSLKKDEEWNNNNEDTHRDKSFKRDIIWVPASKSKVPSHLDEKTGIANNSNSMTQPLEPEKPLRQDSLMTSAYYSATSTKEDKNSKELFDFSQDRLDPIQLLKAASREKERKGDGLIESTENIKGHNKETGHEVEAKTRTMQNSNEFDEDKEINDRTNYSDIDNMVEEKILNNQIEPSSDIMFDQVELEPRETLEALEDNKRPLWEDIDTQQVLKDIKTSDNLDMFSQRIMVPDKMKKEEQQEEPLKEEDKDYFDTIFSEIREEPMAVVPGIFNLGMKFSSDKQPQDRDLNRSNSICSRSFDQELIDLGKNVYNKPLPAFRNHRSQQEIESKTPTRESEKYSLVNNYEGPNSTDYPQRVFCKLIPNNHANVWYYRDLEGMIQGPFSSQLMDSWYNKGYLSLELNVTLANSSGFRKIRDIVQITSTIQDTSNFKGNNAPIQTKAFNNYNATRINHDANDLDETQNEINNSIENIISENCCPNVHYNYAQNAIPTSLKASLPYHNQESNRLHFDCSINKPSQVYQSNQFQGFDYNRNYLRNLPR